MLPDVSTVVLPITVPLHELRTALDAEIPHKLTEHMQMQEAGSLMLQVTSSLIRSGVVELSATDDGFRVVIPVQAACMITPTGLQSTTRAAVGEAEVRFTLAPKITADWDSEFGLRSEYVWLHPLGKEQLLGVTINLQTMVDQQLAKQLVQLTAVLRQTFYQTLRLRQRAEELWAKYQQPQALPSDLLGIVPPAWSEAVSPLYLLARPKSLRLSSLHVPLNALYWAAALELELRISSSSVSSGNLVNDKDSVSETPTAPPAIQEVSTVEVPDEASQLNLSIETDYAHLSQWLSQQLINKVVNLPFSWLSRIKFLKIEIYPTEQLGLLSAIVQVELLEPAQLEGLQNFGVAALRGKMTFDVSARPILAGNTFALEDLQIKVRRGGLASKLLERLLTESAQAEIMSYLRFDLGPYVRLAQVSLKRLLPHKIPLSNRLARSLQVVLEGEVGELKLSGLVVRSETVALLVSVQGELALITEAQKPQLEIMAH